MRRDIPLELVLQSFDLRLEDQGFIVIYFHRAAFRTRRLTLDFALVGVRILLERENLAYEVCVLLVLG